MVVSQTGRTGVLGYRTAMTGQQEKTVRTGQLRQESQARKRGKDGQNTTAWIGQLGKTARI
jgi:hypothetical protein